MSLILLHDSEDRLIQAKRDEAHFAQLSKHTLQPATRKLYMAVLICSWDAGNRRPKNVWKIKAIPSHSEIL